MKQKPHEEIKLWLIEVDWDPEPWEDYSMPYSVFRGTKKQAQKYVDYLYENAKQELYSGPTPFIEQEIVEPGGKKRLTKDHIGIGKTAFPFPEEGEA